MIIDGFMPINEVFKWPYWWTNMTTVKFQMIERLENCLMTATWLCDDLYDRYAKIQKLKVGKVKALSTN